MVKVWDIPIYLEGNISLHTIRTSEIRPYSSDLVARHDDARINLASALVNLKVCMDEFNTVQQEALADCCLPHQQRIGRD